MFAQFSEPVAAVMCLAYQEADRLRHDYIGAEHVLVGLAGHEDGSAAGILVRSGLRPDILRSRIDALVSAGVLPGPRRNTEDLLRSIGIDLTAVRRAAEESFGADALAAASKRARSRSPLRYAPVMTAGPPGPLCGKAVLIKRSFEFARRAAGGHDAAHVGTGHLLIGVLRDAEDPVGTGLSRRAKRMGAALGLPRGGPSPVRLIVEGAGLSLQTLRERVIAHN
jgi:ATP-dependent Clp protease ATP-binding subunit ClpA